MHPIHYHVECKQLVGHVLDHNYLLIEEGKAAHKYSSRLMLFLNEWLPFNSVRERT